ncbi:MAG TPA: sigma-70 family RNA polymerase sigma factor [Candidatus Hydrogenedentes bacterium]|nr:sigma-70 family RNA polymerase sigma factor [Candidatus Hydrogenedentota bacterium]
MMNLKPRTERESRDVDELALAFRDGDERAFDELVRRLEGKVFAVAYRMTSNREDALDVAQETFLKVYRKIHTWRPTGGFVPWVMRLAANQSIDLLRRNKRRRSEAFNEAYVPERVGAAVEPTSMDTERRVRANEIDARIQAALPCLSASQRAVFVLRHYDGMHLAEIAHVLGCTVGSVKVHLFRALRKLQQELGDLHDEAVRMEKE